MFKFKGADEKDFRDKLLNLINNPALPDEYWTYHSDLATMEKHIEEFLQIYGKDKTSVIL